MEWQSEIQSLYKKFLISIGQCERCGNSLSFMDVSQQTLLCAPCLSDLPLFKQTIIQGDLLNWPSINKALPNINFDHLICLAPYLPPFTHWLPQLKYQGRFELAALFTSLLSHQWQDQKLFEHFKPVDLILSVPLHISKWQIRGYNQSHLIAKRLAKSLRLPYNATALVRIRNNISQVGQTGEQRRHNLSNAFRLNTALPKNIKHVMLIDDVLTTGSTANEISKVLKHAGVVKVTITTVCLTLPKTT